MKKLLLLILSAFFLLSGTPNDKNQPRDGDIIFQISESDLSLAIQLATKSQYSHCGIIYKEGNKYYVFEAVQPVRKTLLSKWITRGKNGHYVIKRLKNADKILTSETLQKMKDIGKKFSGKDYDGYFNWSDERIYCSELVWKIYKRGAGLEIGKIQKFKELDLTHQLVKQEIKERYGDIVPLDDTVISPGNIFKSNLLITVDH